MKVIYTKTAPDAVGPYSQAIKLENGFLYSSGQIGIDPKTNALVDGGVEKQMVRVMENVKAILAEAKYALSDIVKTTVFLTDMNSFAAINKIYQDYFGEHKPARSCFEISALPKGGLVEVEFVAFK